MIGAIVLGLEDIVLTQFGFDEDKIKKCVQYQEKQERLEEQQKFDFGPL
ncbi:MAG: hypothetical protein WC780_01635 [Lentimicrobiaceae bacterium]|jgi:hypothetical protein